MIVFVVGYVGLINCARFRGFRGWAAVAVIVTTLSLIGAIARAVSGISLNETRELYDAATAINAQTPKKIDSITTIKKAEYVDDVFTYYYDIDPTGYQSPNWSVDRLKTTIKTNACDTFKGSLGTAVLRSVRYVYKTGASGNIVIEIGESDCEAARLGSAKCLSLF